MEYAIDQDSQEVLEQVPALVARYGYRQKEVLKILKKDLAEAREKKQKGRTSVRKSSDPTELSRLARRIDAFRPDVIYTYGSTVPLHPLFCRRFLSIYIV